MSATPLLSLSLSYRRRSPVNTWGRSSLAFNIFIRFAYSHVLRERINLPMFAGRSLVRLSIAVCLLKLIPNGAPEERSLINQRMRPERTSPDGRRDGPQFMGDDGASEGYRQLDGTAHERSKSRKAHIWVLSLMKELLTNMTFSVSGKKLLIFTIKCQIMKES